MSLGLKHVILPDGSQIAFRVALSFLLYRAPGLSQQTQPDDSLPQYDLHAETEIKRVINGVNLLSLGTRTAFGAIIKNGADKVHIYLCTKPFQEEMGISFEKGGQIPGASPKVKQDSSDVVLARELGKDVDTFLLSDDKVKPVWHWRTSKSAPAREAR